MREEKGLKGYTEPSASTTTIPPAAPAAAAIKVAEIDVGKGLNADMTLKDKTDDFGVRDTSICRGKD